MANNISKYEWCAFPKGAIKKVNDIDVAHISKNNSKLKTKTPLKKINKPINKKSKNKEEVTKKTYNEVSQRDKQTCRLLDKDCKGKLELHHIIYKSQDKAKINDISNCVMLCLTHHQLVHSNKKKYMTLLKEMIK